VEFPCDAAKDIFNSGCGLNPKPELLNCVKSPETVYRDVDFGASVVLGTHADGKQMLYAGQKSGSVWAFEPDTGKVIWRTALGTGSALGGVHWGIAFDKDTVYAPVSTLWRGDLGRVGWRSEDQPGLYALNAKTGKIEVAVQPRTDAGRSWREWPGPRSSDVGGSCRDRWRGHRRDAGRDTACGGRQHRGAALEEGDGAKLRDG
jgi:polyvinyl alcohol dehydrogenase (cytochrome)